MHRLIVPVVLALAFLYSGRAEAAVKKRALPEVAKVDSHQHARVEAKHWVLDASGQWRLGVNQPS